MLKSSFILISILIVVGCSEEKPPQQSELPKQEYQPLIIEDEESGRYTEWYPGHNQIKISGRKDKNENRTGIWKYFSEQGVELSIVMYNAGLKDGHTVVKYPNGAVHYTGEYLADEPIGEWKFYNEQGQLEEIKDYSK